MKQPDVAPAFFGERRFVSADTHDAVMALLSRLEDLIDEETAMLLAHVHTGLADTTRRKRLALLELNHHVRNMDNTVPSQTIMARLAAFRKRLDANGAALKVELAAAQEVNSIIVRAIREAESDGTYSRAHGRGVYDM